MPAPRTCGAIVVVEDPFVSGFLRNILERQGYKVISVEAQDGVSLLRSGGPGIGLLITNLPSEFAEFAGTVPLLYIAAFPDPSAASAFRKSRLLRKPFHTGQLLACVEQLLLPM